MGGWSGWGGFGFGAVRLQRLHATITSTNTSARPALLHAAAQPATVRAAHRDALHQPPLDAHGHRGEGAGAAAARACQPQPHHQAVNIHKLHVAAVRHQVGADLVIDQVGRWWGVVHSALR